MEWEEFLKLPYRERADRVAGLMGTLTRCLIPGFDGGNLLVQEVVPVNLLLPDSSE